MTKIELFLIIIIPVILALIYRYMWAMVGLDIE
jgi:hypothetical protein